MRRLILLGLTVSALAQSTDGCELEAVSRWNTFAAHANSYAKSRNAGVRDLRTRQKLNDEWQAIMRCQCW